MLNFEGAGKPSVFGLIMKLFTVLNLNQQHMGKHADVTWHWTGTGGHISKFPQDV